MTIRGYTALAKKSPFEKPEWTFWPAQYLLPPLKYLQWLISICCNIQTPKPWLSSRGLSPPLALEQGWATSARGPKLSWCPSLSVAAAAKSLQSCPTLCDPIDGSPLGSPVPGILQARTLEWVAISFSNVWKWKVKVKSLSRVQPSATPRTAAFQAPPSMGFPGKSTGVGCHCLLRALSVKLRNNRQVTLLASGVQHNDSICYMSWNDRPNHAVHVQV